MTSFIKFPKYKNYPSLLQIGFKSGINKIIVGKKILVILDCTGSMSESINPNKEGTKSAFAKEIIKQIIETNPFSIVEILPFAEKTKPIVSFENIPDPGGSTKFTPIFDIISTIITDDSEYIATIFISDGLPSEPQDIALAAIKKTGTYCREVNTNTIAVAIGSDADGIACSLFTGNRGYNCFVKFKNEINQTVNDIGNGIKCNFALVKEDVWIPIEPDGKYYYLDDLITSDKTELDIKPTIEYVRKYISLIIHEELNSSDKINVPNLITFINQVVKCLDNEQEQTEIIRFFTQSFVLLNNVTSEYNNTPALRSATNQVYRSYSAPSTGI